MNFRNRTWLFVVALHLGAIFPVLAQVADPILGVTGVNNSTQTVTVSVSDTTSGATIRYTMDGSTPIPTSTIITSGSTLNLGQTTTLKVVAFSGTAMSNLITGQYTDAGLISSSGDHTVVINKDGTVSAWGNGASGQLGAGGTSSSNLPVQTKITGSTPFTGAYPVRALTSTTLSQLPVTSGLSAWYKAESITSGVGSPVTSWSDSSSNGHTATNSSHQPTLVNDAGTGKPAVQFSGSQWLYNTDTIQGVNDVTIITVATGNGTGITATVGGSFGSNGSRGFGNLSGKAAFVAGLSSGGALVDVTSGTVPATANLVASTLTYSSSTSTATFYSNGTQNGTPQTQSTVAVIPGLIIGDTINYDVFNNWTGSVSEILVYNRVLTTTERQQVELYLINKYGIYSPNATWILSYSPAVQAEIARDQLTKAQADAYVAFQAANPGVLTNGLKLWLAADSITASNGSLVGSWTDKAGNFTLSQSNSTLQPTFVANDSNGKPALRFSSNSTNLTSSSSVPGINNDMTIVTVAMTTTATPSGEDSVYLGTSGRRGLGYQGSKQYFEAGGFITTGAASPPANTFVTEIASLAPLQTNSVNTFSFVTYYRNGTQTSGPTVVGGLLTPDSGIRIGFAWNGDIAEALVYDHQLSSTEIQQVTLYLANKYGLYYPSAAWISNYASAVQTRINQNQWNRAQADAYVNSYATLVANNPSMLTRGLAVWFKGDAQLAHTGTNVTQWTDQVTGNVLVPTNTSSEPQYVASDLNGVPGVQFTGSSGLKAAVSNLLGFTLNADLTMITVGMTTAPGTQQTSVDLGFSRITGYKNSLEYFGNQSNYNYSGVAVPSASTFNIEATSLNSDQNAVSFYQNGVNSTSLPIDFGIPSVGAGIWIGVNSDGTDFGWTGNIDEILIYDHQLSPTEMQQVSAYLAAKYNLTVGGFPYPPPIITPPGGSSSSNFSVSFSAAPAGTTIRYTLDGSDPTWTSGTQYTSAFSVASSLMVRCAIFQGPVQASAVTTAQFYVGDSGHIGISDAWQILYFGHTGIDPSGDPLGSGLTYLQKFQLGYDPTKYSTNGDGLSDGLNNYLGYAGSNTDVDADGLTNAQEYLIGTNPFNPDTDADSHLDGADFYPLDPTRWMPPTDPGDHTPPTVTLTIPQGATQIQ